MELEKIPEEAVQVGSHWEWQEDSLTVRGWADENGYLHREGAPAKIWCRKDGRTIWREVWWLHGQPHREGAPAEIWYHKDGTIEWEFWFLHGQDTEALYPKEAYQDLQKLIGRPGSLRESNSSTLGILLIEIYTIK